jgi:cardiolipin synthase
VKKRLWITDPILQLKIKTNIPTHENIYTIPNILTFSRLLASPYIGYLIVQGRYPLALGIFAVAGITDMVSFT